MKKIYLAKLRVLLVFGLLAFGQLLQAQTTWYAINSGNWDDPNNWTLDPAAAVYVNPTNSYPQAADDNAVIKTGLTITIPVKTPDPALVLNCGSLTVNGRLELLTTSGHSFTAIKGNGRIIMQGDNFPAGDATQFITDGQGGGTVVLQGNSFTLATDQTFYNLEVDMTAGQTVSLAANYTLNGNLRIISGSLNIGNSTTTQTLVVYGDVTVNSGTVFGTTEANAVHLVEVYGNFTNNGTVDFSNSTQYNAATNGAVKISFKGFSNNNLVCNGPTDFYRMFIDKGTDKTFTLSVNASNPDYFKLFGPVSGSDGIEVTDGTGGWERLALVIKNGTLKLESNINIPRLGENRTGDSPNEFHIPYSAALWINGATVSSSDAAGGWRGTTVFGTLHVSAGSFTNPAGTGGITYFSNSGQPGVLKITGGDIYTTQLKQADGSGQFNYLQSGGSLHINALSDSRGSSAIFALPQSTHVFEMTGGSIIIDAVNTTATNGIDIGVGEGNYNVTGGTIEIQTPTLDAAAEPQFIINSTAPFFNLTISQSGHSDSQSVVLNQDLIVLNNLSIGSGTILNASGQNLSIGGNLDVAAGGTYTQTTGALTFNSDKNSIFTNNYASFSIPSIIINKTSPANTVALSGSSVPAVTSLLKIEKGIFNLADNTLNLSGNIELYDGNITSGTGKIVLNGTTKQTLYSEMGKDNSFGAFDLNNTYGTAPQIELLSHVKISNLHFARNQIVNIGGYNLELMGSLTKAGGVTWAYNRSMFRTNGLSSDGGLTLPINLNGNYSTTSVQYFPVGIYDAGSSPTNRFTPGEVFANGTGLSSSGSITMKPVNGKHPTSDTNASVLPYYWSASYTGLSGVESNLRYYFTYDKSYTSETSGAVLKTDNTWSYQTSVRTTDNTYRFPLSFPLSKDYTLGRNNDFNNVRTLYTRNAATPPLYWNDRNIWSSTGHDGGAIGAGQAPSPGDRIIIGNGHRVNVVSDGSGQYTNITVGELIFEHDTAVSNGFEDIPRLQVEQGNTMNLNRVSGTGMLTQWIDNDRDPVINGDLGDFAGQKYSWFLYVGAGSNTEITLPSTPTIYPNLATEGDGKKLILERNIIVNGDLNPRGNSTLLLNDGTSGNITINGDLVIGDYLQGGLEFPAGNNARTVTVKGDIDFTRSVSEPTNARVISVTNDTGTALHKLIVHGNIIQGVGVLDLFNSEARPKVDLYFESSINSTFNRSGSERTDLYRVFVNKTNSNNIVEFQNSFELNGSASSATKPLTLLSGITHLKSNSINIDLTTGGANFKIPSVSTLRVDNGATVNLSGSNTGIWLDGSLILDNGAVLDGDDNGSINNYIEYTASGLSSIWLGANTQFLLGSQLRRTTTTDEGILNFNQTDATSVVTVGITDAPTANRGVFEIVNNSTFSQAANANITIVRGQTSASVPALIMSPATAPTLETGSGFTMGNASTPGGEIMGIYASHPLMNLTVGSTSNPTVTVKTDALTLNGNLTIGGTFDANGLDLTILGNLENNGTFVHNNNNTYFAGTANQSISGTGTTAFYNLEKNGGTATISLGTGHSITVDNNLTLRTGAFNTNENNVIVKGNGSIYEGFYTYSSGASEGFVMQGSSLQQLSGSGTFARLTIDNANGVVIPTQSSSVNYSEALRLKQGVLDIGRNLMIIEKSATIEAVNAFSSTNMIQTNLSFTDAGIRKYLPSGALADFVFPIGAAGKYTPVTLNITQNSSETGYLRVKAANEPHITVLDPNNALHYNWTLEAANVTNLSGNVIMQAYPADVYATNADSLNAYIAARILAGSSQWEKFSNIYEEANLIEGFDKDNSRLVFRFINNNASEMSGDYTAGTAYAIPNEIPSYITVANGDWTTPETWARYFPDTNTIGETGFVPRGSIIYVDKNLSIAQNFMSAFRTNILPTGTITVGNTINHRFGSVAGQGRLVLQNASFPAGSYEDFLSENGGTIEFTGATDYDVLSEKPIVNNLVFSGSGLRRLVNLDLTILGSLTIDGATLVNEFSQDIDINKNITFDAGSFVGNTGSIIASGSALQTIGGLASGGFTGSNSFYNLEVNNPAGINLDIPVDVTNTLTLTSGIVATDDVALLTITNTSNAALVGASSARYIDGPLSKNINTSSTFVFAVGDAGRYGPVTVTPTASSGYWKAKYHNYAPSVDGLTTMVPDIEYVSSSEYWEVTAPSTSGAANVSVRWDENSGINPAETSNRLVTWKASPEGWTETSASFTGTTSSGSASTSGLTFADFTGNNRITFGSLSIPAYTWTGAVGTDWFTPGNWTGSIVPSASANTTIANTINKPVIAGTTIAQTNALTIQTGATLTVAPSGKLTVNGTLDVADAGGLILENQTGADGLSSMITKGTITGTGDANIKMALPADRWFYLSSPIQSPVFGNFDTGASGASVYVFRNNQWYSTGSAHVNTAILDMEGVLVKYDTNPKNLSFNGTPNVGTTAESRTFDAYGWHLFGNPYPSFINWQEDLGWSRANIDGTIWYRTLDGTDMAFITYNRWAVAGARAALFPSTSLSNEAELANIPPYQAVWVKAYSATTMTVDNAARTHGVTGSQLKSGSASGEADVIRIVSSNDVSRDGAVIYFAGQSTEAMDRGDSEKRFNDSERIPEIYTRIGTTASAINGLPELGSASRTIPLSVRNRVEGDVTLNFDLSLFESGHSVELEDKVTGTRTNLRATAGYTYTPAVMGEVHDRFVLHINQVTTSIVDPEASTNDNGITIKGFRGRAVVNIPLQLMNTQDAVIEVYTVEGQKVSETTTSISQTVVDLPHVDALYMIRVTAGSETKTGKVLGKAN